MIKLIRIPDVNSQLLELAYQIRTEVFIKEQMVDPELEMDEFDATSTHYIALDDNKPVATARWRETSKGIKLERFAVIAAYRNSGTGTKLLKMVLDDVLPFNKPIYLHSQLKAIDFYARQGFRQKGDIFVEADIQHYRMQYQR